VTSLLFSVGKLLIGIYLGRSGVASGFGAAGSLVIVLLWVYYSAQIFLLGAEFTKTYAYRHGSRSAQPKPAAADKRGGQGATSGSAAQGPGSTPAAGQALRDPQAPAAPRPTPAFAKVRIAAGIAATIGLVAGEIASELRERRLARDGTRRARKATT